MLAILALIATLAPGVNPAPTSIEGAEVIFTMQQVRDRAAAESALANSLAKEIQVIHCSQSKHKNAADPCSVEAILGHLVVHQRGRDAAAAMIVAYKLVAVERRLHHLEETSARIASWRQAVDKLAATGQLKVDDSALQEQEDRLPDAGALLRSGRLKLQLQLASMLNLTMECADLIAIQEPLEVHSGELQLESAIQDALCLRRDLRAIRQTCPCINAENLDSMRKLLATFQPGIGLEITKPSTWLQRCLLVHDKSDEKEAALRKQQCQELARERERQIRSEVIAAAVNLEEAYERLQIAEDYAAKSKQRISQRRKLSELELASGVQIIRSELESLAAEDLVMQRRVSAREAEILWISAQEKLLCSDDF
jgi:hypothetical protein